MKQASTKSGVRAKKPHATFSLRAHLIWFMLIFLAVVLLVTWLFQVALLDVLYESVRMHDLERASEQVADALGGEQLQEVVYDVAMDGLMGVLVYRMDGDRATEIVSGNATAPEGSIFIATEHMSKLYLKAQKAGGTYHAKVTFGGHEVEHSFWQTLFPPDQSDVETVVTPEMMNLMYIRLCEDADQNQYMILLNTALSPLTPMVHTLKSQFVWIFTILLVVAIILTVPISRHISRPIVQMNEAAKQLARGNYNANFEADGGYRETQELAKSLNYASQELSRTDQLQKELIANISHDLRTPLTMIRGYAETMRDIPGENTPENVQVLIDEAEHLTELVNDLLDLSKIRSGVKCPTMEFFNLTSAIREVMDRYEAFTKAQGYHIDLQADQDVPIFADRSMILQVIYNLINNAINYTGEDLKVTVIQTVQKGTVRIAVQDTGEGIAPEQIPLIWDRYYKVDKVHRMARVGTGLGLSIVKGILEVHGALYGVESTQGNGSVFWFELPVSEPPVTVE